MNDSLFQLLILIGVGYFPAAIFVLWMTISNHKLVSEIDEGRFYRGETVEDHWLRDELIFWTHILAPGWNILVAFLFLLMHGMNEIARLADMDDRDHAVWPDA